MKVAWSQSLTKASRPTAGLPSQAILTEIPVQPVVGYHVLQSGIPVLQRYIEMGTLALGTSSFPGYFILVPGDSATL